MALLLFTTGEWPIVNMGAYIDNIINQKTGDFFIEHKNKPRWVLFDIDQINKNTKLIWFNDPGFLRIHAVCLNWELREKVKQFLSESNISEKRVNIIEIIKG